MSETSIKPGAFFDVDGTIFKSSLLEKVVEEGVNEGVFVREAFEKAARIRINWQDDNREGTYLAYIDELVGSFVTSIAGVSVADMEALTNNVIEKHRVRRFRFPRILMERVTERETHTPVIISGSPDFLVRKFTLPHGTEQVYGSTFDIQYGAFTGSATPVGTKAAVRTRLIEAGLLLDTDDIAIGDTTGGLPILRSVQHPIMFNPSKTLADYGAEFGWPQVLEVKDRITVLEMDNGFRQTSVDSLLGRILS